MRPSPKYMWRSFSLAIPVLLLSSGLFLTGAQQRPVSTSADCSFLQDPEEYLEAAERHRLQTSSTTEAVVAAVRHHIYFLRGSDSSIATDTIPRRNLIDDQIFGRMERDGIRPAPLASDQEFLRRVMLDLTGRIPSAQEVTAFVADKASGKRDALIDRLLETPEFVDKWTMFFGDLFKNNGPATNINRYFQGRDAFYRYIYDSVGTNKPYNQIAYELITATGDSFESGPPNWIAGGTVPMGPAQDTYDGMAVQTAQMFLGINVVDCVLCHDGTRHLDSVNLWGKQQTRMNMWGFSAFFARTRQQRVVVSQQPLYAKTLVTELAAGDYNLNTTTGNRTARQPVNGVTRVSPRYPLTGETGGVSGNRREMLAQMVTSDLQFSRAAVNYIWEQFMVEPFVSPSNAFDPARLDPANPPPAPWTLQPTNPQLLNALAAWFRDNDYNIRSLMGLITKSSAYQLSSVYPGEWKPAYVPYYARKFVRRLQAEEVHDAIVKATGVIPRYTLEVQGADYSLTPVNWAMQLPDTREPRSNGAVAQFLNSFGRGDRDQTVRNTNGSPLQALNLMNNTFVMNRIHANNNGSTVQRVLRETTSPAVIVEQLFLNTLSRYPSDAERAIALDAIRWLGNQRAAEALQWSLLNKLDFVYNY